MTKQEAASALELLHGTGMSYVEVASWCGCTVRELEQLSEKAMTFQRDNWQNSNITLKRQSIINWPEELVSISEINDNRQY